MLRTKIAQRHAHPVERREGPVNMKKYLKCHGIDMKHGGVNREYERRPGPVHPRAGRKYTVQEITETSIKWPSTRKIEQNTAEVATMHADTPESDNTVVTAQWLRDLVDIAAEELKHPQRFTLPNGQTMYGTARSLQFAMADPRSWLPPRERGYTDKQCIKAWKKLASPCKYLHEKVETVTYSETEDEDGVRQRQQDCKVYWRSSSSSSDNSSEAGDDENRSARSAARSAESADDDGDRQMREQSVERPEETARNSRDTSQDSLTGQLSQVKQENEDNPFSARARQRMTECSIYPREEGSAE